MSVTQESVTFCVGESYTLSAAAENVKNPVFIWSVDGDFPEDVVSLSQEGNSVKITALKVGETKLIAALEHGDHVYFRSVKITVKESSGVTLVLSDNVGFDNGGYHVDLSTLTTNAGDFVSLVPLVSAYQNNKAVTVQSVTWHSENTDVVAVKNGNTLSSVSEGKTNVIGVCVVGGKEYSVSISVNVYRPVIDLGEKFVVEVGVEKPAPLEISSALQGNVQGVTYQGKSVGSFDLQSKAIVLEKDKLPTSAADLGENRQLVVETSLASYTVDVDLYTKIISDKAEFDQMAALSKACNKNAAIWDGYFILDNDIEYNDLCVSKIADLDSLWAAVEGNWSNGGLYGFKGVFDGKGHNVDGVRIDNGEQLGALFGVLHIDGVVKNVSFTNASVAANSGFVCGAGGGSVENVYIQYNSLGDGTQHYEGNGSVNTHCASFFSFKEPTATANVTNCVVDVSKATINANASVKLVGSEFASIKNVFVIGGTKELQDKSNATLVFDTIADFVDNKSAQGKYQKFDGSFWALEDRVPVSKSVYEKVRGNGVNFVETVDKLVTGTSYKFLLDNHYVKITSNNENVKIQSGLGVVSATANNGESVTITATSIFDATKSASFTCSLKAVAPNQYTDLTEDGKVAFYDIALDKVYFADVADKINGDEVLYFVDESLASSGFAKDGEGAKTLLAVTADGFYKFNCVSVAKVIENAEDLHYIRRNYTVDSYGHKGKYDGKIIGTYVLLDDIDCTGLVLEDSGNYWENSRGFGGTFDGRGHTISNLTVGMNGLFGAVAHATIKNVNFTGVKLTSSGNGAYVALFASRMFNTTVENVSMEFVSYVPGENISGTSGLMFYETSFDCTFKGLTFDISQLSGVKYLTECLYGADKPNLSVAKSTYESITVIVANLNEVPVFAYKLGNGGAEDIVNYPDGFTIKDVNGNVKQ